MSRRLSGKVAFVTAAGQGIGKAAAITFQSEGATVWATDIDASALRKLEAENPEIQTRELDVRDDLSVRRIVAEIGSIDVLLNCAGYVHHGTILECSDSDWDLSFELNVKSTFRVCRAVLPSMMDRRTGSIINVSSAVSTLKSAPNRFVYQSTKAAVLGLTKSIALDFVRYGIRCNAICPGTIDTPSLQARILAQKDPGEARRQFLARQPIGRFGTPSEVGALALYLASDESTFTTGQAHVIDGGWTL